MAILSAPSNLGLEPPRVGSVPGCAKAPEALREAGLHAMLAATGAIDAGVVLPGRYSDDQERGAERLRNQEAIVDHARRLAARLDALLDSGHRPLVLGGDCSLLVGIGLALSRLGGYGLVHVDGHTDYRHPGNSQHCASLAGEDLAAATGSHWGSVANIDGLGPYFDPGQTVHVGCREDDEHLLEVRAVLAAAYTSTDVGRDVATVLDAVRHILNGTDGYWIHLDVDVLDPQFMPAVDSPAPGGLTPAELVGLLHALAPRAVGADIAILDPDRDPSGSCAQLVAAIVCTGLAHLGRDLPP